MSSGQLAFVLDLPAPNPNRALLDDHGRPRWLLWCSDGARMGGPCPYTGPRARFRPAGGCCKQLVGGPGDA